MKLMLKWMTGRSMLKQTCNHVGSSKKFVLSTLPEESQVNQPKNSVDMVLKCENPNTKGVRQVQSKTKGAKQARQYTSKGKQDDYMLSEHQRDKMVMPVVNAYTAVQLLSSALVSSWIYVVLINETFSYMKRSVRGFQVIQVMRLSGLILNLFAFFQWNFVAL